MKVETLLDAVPALARVARLTAKTISDFDTGRCDAVPFFPWRSYIWRSVGMGLYSSTAKKKGLALNKMLHTSWTRNRLFSASACFSILELYIMCVKVLLCMAEQLGKLTAHIGGKQYAHELLEPLEQLAAVEESTVRWLNMHWIMTNVSVSGILAILCGRTMVVGISSPGWFHV